MDTEQKQRQLSDMCELIRDRVNEIFEAAKTASELIGKDAYPNIAGSRMQHLESLLRGMGKRCDRLADEVGTIKG